jgi:nucleotide-binding universal stress UspA family protein
MMTQQRILCAVDFSPGSRHALRYALAIAQWTGAETTVLYVHPLPQPVVGFGPFVEPMAPLTLDAEQRGKLLAELQADVRLEAEPGARVTCLVDQDVNASTGIVACAGRIGAQLIVLGTRGHSGLDHLMLGSVAEKVLRTAACPVLTVPPRAQSGGQRATDVRQVLCPIDFSPISAQAIAWAVDVTRRTGARLTVLHVCEIPPETGDVAWPELVAYRDRLDADARLMLHQSVPEGVRSTIVADEQLAVGRPYKEILRVAHERQADVIVMGVSGHGAIGRFFLGATVQHVVRRAECPVLTVRETAHA